ncbi:MAG TPA: hypothetical protein VFD77_09415 [Brumimicrobium sp.]|nr:hypothetical protein [Brumimicrobium sp.]
MAKSNEDLIRSARSSAVEDFKKRFKQKWFNNTPCFHWKELELSDELKSIVLTEHPSVWLLNYDSSMSFEEIEWKKGDVYSILFFDWLNKELPAIKEAKKENWFQYNISQGLGMLNFNNKELILCYHEGTEPFALEWKTHFEKHLKV